MRTQADDDVYKVQMEAALAICGTKKNAVVAIADAANSVQKPKRKKLFGVF